MTAITFPETLKNSWTVSAALHLSAVCLFLIGYLLEPSKAPPASVEIEVIEQAREAKSAISVSPVKAAQPKAKPARAVFGTGRRSLQSVDGPEVKMGNTLAKTPDQKKLNDSDPDALPNPTEDYLVSEMPILTDEFRIPYPPGSKKAGIEGPVVMDILIDTSGKVRDATLIEGPAPDLNDAALAAIRKFMFKPARVQDRAVAVKIRYSYRFILER